MTRAKAATVSTKRLAIVAPNGMVWTAYDAWRSWEEVLTPRLFHLSDIAEAKAEAQRAKAYAEDDPEFPGNPKLITVATITLTDRP